jgi:hypothetical protein
MATSASIPIADVMHPSTNPGVRRVAPVALVSGLVVALLVLAFLSAPVAGQRAASAGPGPAPAPAPAPAPGPAPLGASWTVRP